MKSILTQVVVGSFRAERFQEVLPEDDYGNFAAAMTRAREELKGRVIWNINSTASGGGVAEMLRSLLAYARGLGVDARWVVIKGDPDFFRTTKRIHNNLHGATGDGGELGDAERALYLATLERNAEELRKLIVPEDIVILHDPQTAGLVPMLESTGAPRVWRCHVGMDRPNDVARRAWSFLHDYVSAADAYVFSRELFAWEGLARDKLFLIAPSIDAFSPKNQPLAESAVEGILARAQIVHGDARRSRRYLREDGTPGRVDRAAVDDGAGAPVPAQSRIVTQVSRWDRLKDPAGVIRGFADYVAPDFDAHLIVAGPDVRKVSDDPEGLEVLNECKEVWSATSKSVQSRVHLLSLPMDDGEENAAIVNALQRRSTVVVQKSLAEGFGLTVAEAMWKARPVVASRIGGIQDQIVDGECGLLVDDPTDLKEYGERVVQMLRDEASAARMGEAARARVRTRFLGTRHLMQWLDLFDRLPQ
jgi:trehalose synthase